MSKPPPGFSEAPPEGFSIFDEIDEAAEERAIEAAEQAIRDGRVIGNEAMMRWISSWGTADELPPPECGE